MEMKHEYHEGPKAGENFEKVMRTFFRAPKTLSAKRPARKPTRRKKNRQRQGLERSSCPVPASGEWYESPFFPVNRA
jgi:hypothetical protein